MPASTTKADLIAVTEKEFAKLETALETVPDGLALVKDEDDTSVKDIVGHRAHWIDLFLGWYTDGQADKEVAFPAPGYKWSDLKAYNAELRASQADLDWETARADLAVAHGRLLAFLRRLDDEALYAGPMKGGRNAWTTGRWAEAAGASHYRSASKYVRARVRAFSG